MEEELSMLKKLLISLVVSSPTTMTVSCLMKDYRSMIGGAIPLAKFGYRELVPFLRERCSDIFVIEGSSWDPILTPKVTKNLAHIDKMVQKQKVQSTVKHKGKRRSILQQNPPTEATSISNSDPPNRYDQPRRYDPPNRYNAPNRFDPQTKVEQQQQNRHVPTNGFNSTKNEKLPVARQQDTKTHNHTYPKINQHMNKENVDNSKIVNNNNHRYTMQYEQSKSTHHEKELESVYSLEEDSSALSKFYRKRLPQYNSDVDIPSPDSEHISRSCADSERLSSTSSSSKQVQLEELKEEIITLIKDSPDGVWCTDLIELYKETYGRELKFGRFGHTRLISLIYSMEDRVAVSRPEPDSDWLLQLHSSAGVQAGAGPAGVRRGATNAGRGGTGAGRGASVAGRGGTGAGRGASGAGRGVPRPLPGQAPPPELDDALPGVDFEADVFPPDCLHYLDSVPAPALAEGAGATLEVLLGEVYSPSHFWMLRVGPEHNVAMELIMDQMNAYYGEGGAGAMRVLARGAVRAGQYCAARYDGDWHRALVVRVLDSDTVKVRHVDYGTVDTVPAGALKPLRREWGALEAQALRARLAGVQPAAGAWRWSRAACAWLLQRVRQRRLFAHLHARDPQEDIVETFLIDTSGAEDACLTRELIRAGHADARPDSALQSEDCYLYPRFEALETGATPNYGDICRMLADGIALEYVDEYRRHVPGPWARRPQPAHWLLLTSAYRAFLPPPPGL